MPLEITPIATLLVSLLALFISGYILILRHYRKNLDHDEKLFDELKITLETAYKRIYEEEKDQFSEHVKYWRMSARNIVIYEKLKKLLKTKLFISLCNEMEENYRAEFHLLADRNKGKDFLPDYNEKLEVNPIALAKIAEFTNRKHWEKDPLYEIELEEFIIKNKLFEHPLSLKEFMKKHHKDEYESVIQKQKSSEQTKID